MNRRTLQVFLIAVLIGASKAHHFIKLVILAGLGLAGLWMVHTLAQDFSQINNQGNHGGGGGGGKAISGELNLYKRSIQDNTPQINWSYVLSRDPAGCARSFICQLVAQDENLTQEEQIILDMTRNSANTDSWASKQLQEALKYGEQVKSQSQCRKIYKICPYSSQTMMTLLKVFGG